MISDKSNNKGNEGWKFFDYCSGGNNPIEGWYQILSLEAKTIFDSILKTNAKTELPINWSGFRHYLKGEPRNYRIWELGFFADKRQHRVFGVFGKERKHAIFLIGCYHKQRVYTPHNALDTAMRRAKDIQEGKAELNERKIKFDI